MASTPISVPKYRHHKGSGQAFVQVSGKRHYLGRFGSPKSKEAYSRFIAELAVTPTAVTPVVKPTTARPPITMVELMASYLDHAEAYYMKDGKVTDQVAVVKRGIRVLRELYGTTPAAAFGPLAFRAVQQKLVETGIARGTVNSTCGAIKLMFKWAASNELIPVTTYHAVATLPNLKKGRTTAREPAPILPVEDALVDATLPYLVPVVADMVRFQRLTGCRPGEVCQLRPMDLDRSDEVWQYHPASHKTQHRNRERVIFIGPKAQAVILPYLLRDAELYCFSPAESETRRITAMRKNRKTKVQPSQQTRRKAKRQRTPKDCYNKRSYNHAIRYGVSKANRAILDEAREFQIEKPKLLAYWAPNRLRHARATEVRKKFGLEASQVVLGHAKADTAQIYAERDHALAADVMLRIG